MTKAEMELIWNGPLQDALRIKDWRPVHVLDLREDGVLPKRAQRQRPPAKKRRGA